jgi:hypothetical protein
MVELDIYQTLAMEVTILLLWLSLMLFALRLVFLVVQAQKKPQSRHITNHKRTVYKHQRRQQHQYKIPKTGQWQELLALVHGDVSTAQRLIEFEQQRNPTRSVEWCIEKALWQIQRDRRA